MTKKVLVILGHPSQNSLCAELHREYVQGAVAAGKEVRQIMLGELEFDPLLKEGYRGNQALEPDLLKAREDILWAEHLVFVYPIWWGGMPALQKGFIDRTFLPGFAFKYRKGSSLWDKLLAGRSAHCLVTMDAPPWYFRWVNRMPGHNQMKKTILEFCGIKPVRITSFGAVKPSSAELRAKWLAQSRAFGLDD